MPNFSFSWRSDYKIACWLMLVLASFYLFFFSGRVHSLDEISSVALTETFLIEGTFHTNQMRLLEILPATQSIFIQEKGWSILLAPWHLFAYWLAQLGSFLGTPDVGIVSMMMLGNWWVTTITGGLLYLLVRRLGYQPTTGILVTLAWGAGTLAFMYSRLLYPQPMEGLILLALIHLTISNHTRESTKHNGSGFSKRLRMGITIAVGAILAFLLLTEMSLLFYMPLLLPALWGILAGLYSLLQRHRTGVLLVGLVITSFLITNVGTDAGIRNWVPLLPLWCLGLAPCWESRRGRLPLILIIALSVLIQLSNMSIDFSSLIIQASNQNIPFTDRLWSLTDQTYLFDFLPLLTNWQAWDIVWLTTGSWYLGLAIFLLCFTSLYSLYQAKKTLSIRLVSTCLLVLVGLTQITAYHDPKWRAYHEDLLPLVKHLNVAPDNSRLLFEVHGYHDYIDRVQAWFNFNHSRVPQTQLVQQNQLDERVLNLLNTTLEQAQWIYLATEGTARGNPISGTERWLGQHAFLARDEWIGPYTRLTVFHSASTASLQPAISRPKPLSDGIMLLEAKTNTHSSEQIIALKPSDPLLISLKWQATQIPEANYTIFVQLLGPYGVVAEQEGFPQANFAPTSSWQTDEIIIDQRAILIPDLPAGDYSLIIGMFNPRTGQRLAIENNKERTISLGIVRVN